MDFFFKTPVSIFVGYSEPQQLARCVSGKFVCWFQQRGKEVVARNEWNQDPFYKIQSDTNLAIRKMICVASFVP